MFRSLDTLIPKKLVVYEFYLQGEMTRRPFNVKGYRVKECLKLFHFDVCGPFNVPTWDDIGTLHHL